MSERVTVWNRSGRYLAVLKKSEIESAYPDPNDPHNVIVITTNERHYFDDCDFEGLAKQLEDEKNEID